MRRAETRLQLHHEETCKLSTDPMFVDKMHDIVELHMDPPLLALVLCVDEKNQIQTLGRTGVAAVGARIPERRTRD